MKKVVPLTAGPGGKQIGEAEVDFDNPTAPMTMRLYDRKDAQMMADMIFGGVISEMSIDPQPESCGITPLLPPEMRDTLGPEVPQFRRKYEGRFANDQQ